MNLSKEELKRYSRHLLLQEIGLEGQQKIKEASVLIVGTGGLGSPLAMYLAASGIGRIGLVDFDNVDISNLQRQIIHGTSDVGESKLSSASKRIKEINPNIQLDLYNERITRENALEIIEGYDIVADGTDNFATRYLINDACVLLKKPNVFGSIRQFEGQVSVYWAEKGPCYRCLFPQPPVAGSVPSCSEAGVMGILPGVIGTIQATEIIKLIIGKGTNLIGKLLRYDALEMEFNKIAFEKDCSCPICGEHASIRELIDYEEFCGKKPPKDLLAYRISTKDLMALIDKGEDIVLLDIRDEFEHKLGRIENSIHIPMQQIAEQLNQIPTDKAVIVYSQMGIKGNKVVKFLKNNGFRNCSNLIGGIDSWQQSQCQKQAF